MVAQGVELEKKVSRDSMKIIDGYESMSFV
jgi:hypothetical protein